MLRSWRDGVMKINHCSDGGPPQMPGGQQFSEFRLSLKPHIEIVVVPALWAVSASSIDLDWNWFVPATDAHHRNAPEGWGETIAPRYVRCKFEHSTAATVGASQIWRLVGSLQDRVPCLLRSSPAKPSSPRSSADRPAAELEECGGKDPRNLVRISQDCNLCLVPEIGTVIGRTP